MRRTPFTVRSTALALAIVASLTAPLPAQQHEVPQPLVGGRAGAHEPMMPPTNATTDPTPRELQAGRVATALVSLEALALVGIAAFYVYELLLGHGTDLMVVIMSVVTMVVFVIGLAYTAKGLAARHPRAQAPATRAAACCGPSSWAR